MTKDEFRQCIINAVEDMNDPNSDFSHIINEGTDVIDDIKAHDPVLAQKFGNVLLALHDVCDYIKTRAEK